MSDFKMFEWWVGEKPPYGGHGAARDGEYDGVPRWCVTTICQTQEHANGRANMLEHPDAQVDKDGARFLFGQIWGGTTTVYADAMAVKP